MTRRQIVLPSRPRNRAPAKPPTPFRLSAKALAGSHEITIYGDISYEDGTAIALHDELRRAAGKPVTLFINSDGGDVYEGLAIYNEILTYPGQVTAKVMSMAGSAASALVMACDRIEIAPTARMMVHQAWCGMCGNAGDHRRIAEELDEIDETLVEIYMDRTRQPVAVIAELVLGGKDTYLTAAQCVELGFADAIMELGPKAMAKGIMFSNHDARREKALARLASLARAASAIPAAKL